MLDIDLLPYWVTVTAGHGDDELIGLRFVKMVKELLDYSLQCTLTKFVVTIEIKSKHKKISGNFIVQTQLTN